MRWPFSLLFRGDRDAPAAADALAGGPGAFGAAPGPAAGAGVPARPADWRGLPPVQRVVGDLPLTAPAVPFARDLAGRRPPDPILRPLAHDFAADGPAGLVSGIATPLAVHAAPAVAAAARPALPAPRGIQRRPRAVSGAPLPGREIVPAADAPLAVASDAAGAAHLHAPAPPRALPVVSPSAATPALAATRVGASTAPETARAVALASGVAASATADDAVRPVPAPAAAPLVAPPAPPSANPRPAAEAAGPRPGGGAPSERPAQPRSLGESRRLGLGAPIAGRPSVQRIAAGTDLPLARSGRATTPALAPTSAAAPLRRAAAAEAALPVLRVAAGRGHPPTPPEAGAAPAGDAAAVHMAATHVDVGIGDERAGPPPSFVGRTAERPLVGDAGSRVENLSAAEADPEPGGDVPAAGSPRAAQRPPGVGPASHAGGVGRGDASGADAVPGWRPGAAQAAAPGATRPIPTDQGRSAPPAPTPAGSVPSTERSGPLVVARSLLGSPPRRPGAVLPVAAPPAIPPAADTAGGVSAARRSADAARSSIAATPVLADAPVPGSLPSGWPVAQRPVAQRSPAGDTGVAPGADARQRRESLPLARAAAVVGPAAPFPGPIPEPVAVSRLADGGGSLPPPAESAMGWSAGSGFVSLPASDPAVVQRSVVIDEMTTQAEPAPAAGGAEGGTGGAGAGGAGQDYEEIAERVYDRIRSRLATELLLDRERMGLLVDG